MLRSVIILPILINLVLCRPQFVSFKDGKIGVNFGGYHAEAGLGALLTGNAAHGGLSASAGTPFGQRAAAGIGGGTGGNSQGGAYASASAGGNVGASAGLGAVAGGDAGVGAEAHVGSLSTSASRGYAGSQVSKQIPIATSVAAINGNTNAIYRNDGGEIDGNVQTNIVKESHIQRIKPPKKYARVHGHAHVAQPSNQINFEEKQIPTTQTESLNKFQQTDNINSESLITIEKSPAATIQIKKRYEQQIPFEVEQQQQQQQQQQQGQQQVNVIETPIQQQNEEKFSISNSNNFVNSATTVTNDNIPNAQINLQKTFNYNLKNDQISNAVSNNNAANTATTSAIHTNYDEDIVTEYSPQPIIIQPAAGAFVTYRKHFRPWRRIHYRKQVVPVIYEQPQTVTVVEKSAVAPQPPQQIFVTKKIEKVPVTKTNYITKTKSISSSSSPSVIYQPIPQPSPPLQSSIGYTKTLTANGGVGAGTNVAGSGSISGNFNAAGLFDSIFNIPIATLKAVNGLVNNVANGISASGSVAVSKSFGAGSY